MKKIIIYLLFIALSLTACGKQDASSQDAASVQETENETESEGQDEEPSETVSHEDLEVHTDDEQPLSDEELEELDDDYFEPENAETVEGMEEAARLSEEYGFYIIGLESVSFITYPDYADVYKNMYGYLRAHKYPVEDVTILLPTVEEDPSGGSFIIVPPGFDEEYDLLCTYSYGGTLGFFNKTVTNKNGRKEPVWKELYGQ